ncbi:hypothetical protein [Thermincola ferriacetica]|nr:hypothetical protein [Thermincola ferriacetica]
MPAGLISHGFDMRRIDDVLIVCRGIMDTTLFRKIGKINENRRSF